MTYIPEELINVPPDEDTPFSLVEKLNANFMAIATEFENVATPELEFGTGPGTVCEGNDGRIVAAVAHGAAAAPHTGHEVTSAKGAANGYASLDDTGKVPAAQIPATAGGVPSGTGFRHVTSGEEDAASKLVADADVATTAAIAESKLALAYGTSALNTAVGTAQSTANAAGIAAAAAQADADTAQSTAEAAQATANAAIPASQKAAASGVASLNASSKVVQDPANATATPTANKIPIADSGGKLSSWVDNAGPAIMGKIQLAGQLSGTAASPTVVGVKESGGQTLSIGAIADGQILKRVGTTIAGETRFCYRTYTVDGAGAAIATGDKGWWVCDVTGAIVEWTLLANVSGSIVFDIWKDTYGNYPPTGADTITGSAKPTLSGAQKGQSNALTGWTTAVSAGDILKFNVDSVATVQRVTLTLKIQV